MITLCKYNAQMEKDYYNAVYQRVSQDIQDQIMKECRIFFPKKVLDDSSTFRDLILMPYPKMKEAIETINNTNHEKMKKTCFDELSNKSLIPRDPYKLMVRTYSKVADAIAGGKSMRVRLVNSQELSVCPYCNRDYINARGGKVSGAQLDHFYNKDNYPFLSLSLYNLIPVCGNCNRVKSKKKGPFASAFDTNIDFVNSLTFDYDDQVTEIQLNIADDMVELSNNITKMKIKEAYQIHTSEIEELLELEIAYKETQLWEIRNTLGKTEVSDEQIKRIIFGPRIEEKDIRKKPLGKMMKDLHKKLKIYP